MQSSNRVREKKSPTPERKGWSMLMRDSSEFNGLDENSTNVFFFEMDWPEFVKEIRDDVNSFFGYPDGCPDESEEAMKHYESMWQKLSQEKEYEENGRRIEFVRSRAIVK